jgi:hypothetical protein
MEGNSEMKFLNTKRHTNTLRGALDGAIRHLQKDSILERVDEAFSGGFGPEPVVDFKIRIRRDAANPEQFTYQSITTVSHEMGDGVKLHGLKND